MNTSDDCRSDEALDEEAAAWLCERDEGFASDRAQAFAEWRVRDSRRAAAVARVERALALLDEMPAVRAPLEARFGPAAHESAAARGAKLVRLPWLVWMAAAALVVGVVAWWSVPLRAPVSERYATDSVAQKRVALRDGSVVDINTASVMQVDFSTRERRVSLSTGEAHFQVAPDVTRPFVVTARDVSVRAVGTAFNVRINDGAVEVIVMEGKVEVVRADARSLLAAGERTNVTRHDPVVAPAIHKAAPGSIRAALAWQDPMTTLHDVPLREVVRRFNQRNTTQLVFDDAQLGDRKIGGVIAFDQVEAFVRLLEQDGDVAVEGRGTEEIRLRRVR